MKKTTKKSSKKKSSSIVAVAIKFIPKNYVAKTNRWIKAHKRLIGYTLTGLTSIYGLYLLDRKNIRVANERFAAESRKVTNQVVGMKKNLNQINDKIFNKIGPLNFEGNQTAFVNKNHGERLSVIEKALTGRDFKDYLDKNHNIVDIKLLKKVKK